MAPRWWWDPRDMSIESEPALNTGEVGPGPEPRVRPAAHGHAEDSPDQHASHPASPRSASDTGDEITGVVPTDPDAVRRTIARERAAESRGDQIDRSVFDEPAFDPGLAGMDRSAGPTFSAWYRERLESTGVMRSWLTAALLGLAAGPTAVLAVFLSGVGSGLESVSQWVTIAVLGPVAEEVLKVVCATITLERCPWLFRSRIQFLAIGVAAGLAFAAIENFLYLRVYLPDPSPAIITWRWTVCVALHTGCSTIAAMGLARAWRTARSRFDRPNIESVFPFLLTAIIIHGVYNTSAIALSFAGVF